MQGYKLRIREMLVLRKRLNHVKDTEIKFIWTD